MYFVLSKKTLMKIFPATSFGSISPSLGSLRIGIRQALPAVQREEKLREAESLSELRETSKCMSRTPERQDVGGQHTAEDGGGRQGRAGDVRGRRELVGGGGGGVGSSEEAVRGRQK
jgi:hypothetical protein